LGATLKSPFSHHYHTHHTHYYPKPKNTQIVAYSGTAYYLSTLGIPLCLLDTPLPCLVALRP